MYRWVFGRPHFQTATRSLTDDPDTFNQIEHFQHHHRGNLDKPRVFAAFTQESRLTLHRTFPDLNTLRTLLTTNGIENINGRLKKLFGYTDVADLMTFLRRCFGTFWCDLSALRTSYMPIINFGQDADA